MADFTTHNNILKAAVGATDIAAVLNGFIDKYEAGRTFKVTAGAAITAGRAVTVDASGLRHAEPADVFMGVSAGTFSAGADAYSFCGRGYVVTVSGAAFTPGGKVYVAAGGEFTQTDWGYGHIGVALTAGTFLVI